MAEKASAWEQYMVSQFSTLQHKENHIAELISNIFHLNHQDPKNLKTGPRITNKISPMKQLKAIPISLLLLVQTGCSDSIEVTVEIDNPKHREIYLRHLINSELEYSVNHDGSFKIIAESQTVLDEKMKGFEEYVSNEILENNKRLKSQH
ncbi:MAG: hypothetical protein K1562_19385 [Candidatus Thiodiazotropha sp. (ex. Lucinisca nassula)]|nr:hypothetical protein [Candidatus Thiodiazotropha sp. (ex. Lucinisca nassula)]